jgi:hypothetical protein
MGRGGLSRAAGCAFHDLRNLLPDLFDRGREFLRFALSPDSLVDVRVLNVSQSF